MLYFIKTDNKNGPENEPAAYDIWSILSNEGL